MVEEKGDVLKQYYELFFVDRFLWKISHTSLIKSNCKSYTKNVVFDFKW